MGNSQGRDSVNIQNAVSIQNNKVADGSLAVCAPAMRPRSPAIHQDRLKATRSEVVIRNYANPRTKPSSKGNFSDSELDWERHQLHRSISRTNSIRGYRPRSASLRRLRSIQRRRFLGDSKSSSKPPSLRTAKMEADNKKIQEEKALLAACARGDLRKVEKLVDSGVDVNSSDESQMTALHYAAMQARDDVIKSLISRGAEVNHTDLKGGFSAMHWVVINSVPQYGSTDHLEDSLTALSKAGCNVNATDFNFATPLHIAAQKGNRDGIQVLLRLGADPDKVDITGRNCFQVAKNELMKHYMKALVDTSLKKDSQTKDDQMDIRHTYHVLEAPITPVPLKKDNQPENRHTYHVLEAPPPSIPAPLPPVSDPSPPVPPPRLVYAGKSTQEEHIYNIPEFQSPPSSPCGDRPVSITPPPPPHRKRCNYPQYTLESHLYHVLEPIPTRQSRKPRPPSPPRRRKARKF